MNKLFIKTENHSPETREWFMVNSMLVKASLFSYRNLMLARFKLQTLAVLGNPGGGTFGHFELDADFLARALEVGLDDAVTGVDCDLR